MLKICKFFSILFIEFPTYDRNQHILSMHKTKKMNKIEKNMPILTISWKISVQLEDDYQNGKNEIRKMYDNFCFLV